MCLIQLIAALVNHKRPIEKGGNYTFSKIGHLIPKSIFERVLGVENAVLGTISLDNYRFRSTRPALKYERSVHERAGGESRVPHETTTRNTLYSNYG